MRTDLYPASVVKKALDNASTLDGIFALILGKLVQGSEYARQTVKTAQTQLAGRVAITLGRLIALALLILLTVLALYAIDSLAASSLATEPGRSKPSGVRGRHRLAKGLDRPQRAITGK